MSELIWTCAWVVTTKESDMLNLLIDIALFWLKILLTSILSSYSGLINNVQVDKASLIDILYL